MSNLEDSISELDECPIILAKKLSDSKLPTIIEILQHIEYLRQEALSSTKFNSPQKSLVKETSIFVNLIWKRTNIPIISNARIECLIHKYYDNFKSLKKREKSHANSRNLKDDIAKFKLTISVLFDLARCKCDDSCICSCPKENHVPDNRRNFITDQRSNRLQLISDIGIDNFSKVDLELQTPQKRGRKKLVHGGKSTITGIIQAHESTLSENNEQIESECTDVCIENNLSAAVRQTSSQSRVKLPNVAHIINRHRLSDRAAAEIVSASLYDFREHFQINIPDNNLVIDRSKIRRERKKCIKNVENNVFDDTNVWGLYFDGKRDKTLVNNEDSKSKTYHRRIVTQEHITLIKEAGSQYIGHVSPTSGQANAICEVICCKLSKIDAPTDKLFALGCDGTVVNTGCNNGIITLLENRLQKPLHWFICLLHLNELPLRHVIEKHYGVAKGPETFCGELNQSLRTCEKMAIINFEKIEGEIPMINEDELSSDQKYLYQIAQAVAKGSCPKKLASLKPGNMSLSRWLTTASRFLRLWVSEKTPNAKLKTVVTYIMKVYVSSWFRIKKYKYCVDGPKHLVHMLQKSRYLPPPLKSLFENTIQNNAYFAHPENILLAMMADDRQSIRKEAYDRVIEIRKKSSDRNFQESVRKFEKPKINVNASSYEFLINWDSNITEPPLTKQLTADQLFIYVQNHLPTDDIFKFPCHTQAVERGVKEVSEMSMQVCDEEIRDGFIKSTLKRRKIMPKFDTKAQFKI